ncbi:MAG: hypothetical protein Rubg2KO_30260 [Rubricoccaceae bacterium]
MTSFDDMQAVWQTTPDLPPPMAPGRQAEIRREAERFDRTIRWRDRREYAGVVLIAFIAVWMGAGASVITQVGAGLMVVGALIAVSNLWRAQRRVPPPAPDLPAADALRQSLARVEVQIELLRSVLWWYLTPIAVGPLVIVGAGVVENVRELPADVSPLAIVGVVGAALFAFGLVIGVYYGIYRLNQKAVETKLIPLRDRFAALLSDLTQDA